MKFAGPSEFLKTHSPNATVNNGTTTAPISLIPSDSMGLLGMLLSFSTINDWLKLVLLGGLFETFRQATTKVLQYLSDFFWFCATVDSEDESYST